MTTLGQMKVKLRVLIIEKYKGLNEVEDIRINDRKDVRIHDRIVKMTGLMKVLLCRINRKLSNNRKQV